jgi:hypothetical protein
LSNEPLEILLEVHNDILRVIIFPDWKNIEYSLSLKT